MNPRKDSCESGVRSDDPLSLVKKLTFRFQVSSIRNQSSVTTVTNETDDIRCGEEN